MPYRLCRHILTSGSQCQSPAMTAQEFCYFHRTFRSRRPAQSRSPELTPELIGPTFDPKGRFTGMQAYPAAGKEAPPLDLGLLEDSDAVQVAISTVINAIATNSIDMRRATALLYGLQLASNNARLRPPVLVSEDEFVRTTVTSTGGELIAQDGLLDGEAWDHDDDELPGAANSSEMTNLPVTADE